MADKSEGLPAFLTTILKHVDQKIAEEIQNQGNEENPLTEKVAELEGQVAELQNQVAENQGNPRIFFQAFRQIEGNFNGTIQFDNIGINEGSAFDGTSFTAPQGTIVYDRT